MTASVRDLAATFRTRNAGAFRVSFDVVFQEPEDYRRWRDAEVFTPEAVGARLHVDPSRVEVFQYPAANAIKVTLPRRTSGGGPTDTDVDSAAQFVPLLDLTLPPDA